MCDPVSLSIAAASISAIGSIAGGIQASNSARYQAAIATQNQKLVAQQGQDAALRGQTDAQQQYRKTAQLLGAQRAAQAANGIDPGFGSAAQVQSDTRMIGQEDAATLRKNTENQVRGYDINSANYAAEAQADRQKASGALVGAAFGAASSILGGASQAGYMKAQGFGGSSSFAKQMAARRQADYGGF